ncbi:hypothetical protein SAMN04488577_2124 [Bacillus sp. cl95]|nr:hypothetical protein SAMN02799634_1024 [Bacillus sp. UNCCL13]SFQ83293.1 hypothetical protein SAMN04488577_2124 [Bacillus sp. cl95]
MSKVDKQKERWNRIKSKGKKRYVLNILLLYVVFSLLLATVQVFVLNRILLSYIPYVISSYIMSIIIFSLLGVWIGNKTWKANTNKF